ncbi:MAG: hypothetical protein IIC03_03015 [Proteobacteria bacterium]|nr:hypothetical protein [Pseudomonadota bacterium]
MKNSKLRKHRSTAALRQSLRAWWDATFPRPGFRRQPAPIRVTATIRCAGLAAVLLAGACTSTNYTETDSEIRLTFGAGGIVNSKVGTYTKFMDTGKRIVIDGQMISADAFIAFSVPGVCYTENAVFSPHAASRLGLWPAPKVTERLTSMLPKPLGDWFRGNIAYYDWIGFAVVEYDELLRIWPEGACNQEDAHTAQLEDRAGDAQPRQTSMREPQ